MAKDVSKYTREILTGVVARSTSVAGVLRLLGVRKTSGSHRLISERIRILGLDTSHFTGTASNRGRTHKGGVPKLRWEDVLVFDRFGDGRRERAIVIRRALIGSGVCEKCVECGCPPSWNGKALQLQIDHVDGEWINNRKENVRFLCSNCHSQTPTFGSRNKVTRQAELRNALPINDGVMLATLADIPKLGVAGAAAKASVSQATVRRWLKRLKDQLAKQKEVKPRKQSPKLVPIEWPLDDSLRGMVWLEPVTSVAMRLGVSGSAVKKRCALRGIDTPGRGYWAKKLALVAEEEDAP